MLTAAFLVHLAKRLEGSQFKAEAYKASDQHEAHSNVSVDLDL